MGQKWFEVKIFISNHFRTHVQRERERSHLERDRTQSPFAVRLWLRIAPRLHRERSLANPEPFDFSPFDFAIRLRLWIAPRLHWERSLANPEPRALWLHTLRLHHSTLTSNRTQIAPFDFTGEPRAQIKPLTSLRLHPRIALRWHQSHWDRNWEMVGFWWIWPDLTGFNEFFLVGFCFYVYLLRNGIIYLFGSWENVRNKKKMYFLYYFQQHN